MFTANMSIKNGDGFKKYVNKNLCESSEFTKVSCYRFCGE
jgi:hypothetical protein